MQRSEGGTGTHVTLNFNGSIWNNNFGAVTNSIVSSSYKYKKTTESTWITGTTDMTPIISAQTFSKSTEIAGDLGANGFDINYSYNIEITVTDRLSTHIFNILLGSGKPAYAVHRDGVSFGAPYNEVLGGALQVNGIRIDS